MEVVPSCIILKPLISSEKIAITDSETLYEVLDCLTDNRPLAELFYGRVEGFYMNMLSQCDTNKLYDCPIENLNVWLGYNDAHLMR